MPSIVRSSDQVNRKSPRSRLLIPLVAIVSAAAVAGTLLIQDNSSPRPAQADAPRHGESSAAPAPWKTSTPMDGGLTTTLAPAPLSERSLMAEQVSLWMSRALAVQPDVIRASRRQNNASAGSGQPQQDGLWTDPRDWPLIAIHAALLPDGRVATYGTNADGQQTGKFIYDIWDPNAAALDSGHLTLPNTTNTDLFCNAQTLLPGGELFMAGGDRYVNGKTTNRGNNDSVLLSSASNSLLAGKDMHRPRWYASVTTLADARIFIMGGKDGNDRPEVRQTDGNFQLLSELSTNEFDFWYPRNFLGIDNRVFGFDSQGRMYWMDADDDGYKQRLTNLVSDFTGRGATQVMYAPGQILAFGGKSTRVAMLSINQPVPSVREGSKLSSRRYWANSTVLPDGQVLVTGGSSGDSQVTHSSSGFNNTVELWDPDTGQWRQGATGTLPRLYHSTALLLPDASVLLAGGGAPGPLINTNAERYLPPYLFNEQGQLAQRPRITAATRVVNPGEELLLGVADGTPIAQVVLIRAGSVTHSFNFDQRRVVLAHQQSGSDIAAKVPDNGAVVPPGYYLLFVVDAVGVPSVAKLVQLGQGDASAVGAEWIGTIGGTGGSDFTLECGNDEVLAGMHGRYGNTTISGVGARCVKVAADGTWLGQPFNGDATGRTASRSFVRDCPRDHAVIGMSGRSGSHLNQLRLSCGKLLSASRVEADAISLAAAGRSSSGRARPLRTCAFNGVARAVYGNSGSLINAAGLLCRAEDAVNEYPYFVTSNTSIQGEYWNGTAFNLACHSDEVLVGAAGVAATQVKQLSPLCVKVDNEGRWISAVMARNSTGVAGGEGGVDFKQLCAEGQAVSGLRSSGSNGADQIVCQSLSSAGRLVSGPGLAPEIGGNDGRGEADAGLGCDRRPAHGLIGSFIAGQGINAIGLSCRGQ